MAPHVESFAALGARTVAYGRLSRPVALATASRREARRARAKQESHHALRSTAHLRDRQRTDRIFSRRFEGPWNSVHRRPTRQESITGDGRAATVFETLASAQDILPPEIARDLSRDIFVWPTFDLLSI